MWKARKKDESEYMGLLAYERSKPVITFGMLEVLAKFCSGATSLDHDSKAIKTCEPINFGISQPVDADPF